jgi:hypothetical protein
MNRYVRAATAALVIAGGLGSVGCAGRAGSTGDGARGNCIDPSWPDRYNYAARQAVIAPFAQQVANGHFINQVMWNWYFDAGTDKLNGAGMEKLDSIARTTPNPDTKLFIQAARDIGVTADNAAKIGAMRDDITAKRAAAIHRYMATQPGPTVIYDISVVDMPTAGIAAPFATGSYRGQLAGYRGAISGGGGVGSGSGTINSGTSLLIAPATSGGGGTGTTGGGTTGGGAGTTGGGTSGGPNY